MNKEDFHAQLRRFADGKRSYAELAQIIDRSPATIADMCRLLNLPRRARGTGEPKKPTVESAELTAKIRALADGERSAADIAAHLGIRRKVVESRLYKYALPRRARGSARFELNGQWQGGRTISVDGYAYLSDGHKGRRLEHRMVMEAMIGRPLLPSEVVDHIDSLHLHNAPHNLRLFASNADHIRATISGQVPQWSRAGLRKQGLSNRQRADLPEVHTYRLAKESGDVRLLQILLAMCKLGTESPYLFGTHRWLARRQIDDFSRPSLERHIHQLCAKWEWNRLAS